VPAPVIDVATESVRTATTDPYTFSHTPTAGLRNAGVVITSVQNPATGTITTVTYGGITIPLLQSATDSAGEPGRAEMYFLGRDIPEGTQTVSVDLSSAFGDDMQFVCINFEGFHDIDVVDSDANQGDVPDPSLVMQVGGRLCLSIIAAYTGANAPSDLTMLSGMTAIHDHDFGTKSARVDRQTTADTADFTIGYTAAQDDTARVAAAFTAIEARQVRHTPYRYW